MDLKKIPAGKNPPEDIYVVIEIPQGSGIKYEVDKESGAVFVDRFLFTAMYYPFNYGFIPNTLADDGDPTDVLVISREPVFPGSVIRARPIGMLEMEDEEGIDTKIIAVPVSKLDKTFENIKEVSDLPQATLDKIKHFFEHYKELESGKWVKVKSFKDSNAAKEDITKAIQNFKNT
ncbi:MAG: inorganic diphosphatase [Sulfurihydrogenibium sp.]|jgi:inorganic pyrophosphatase|uniref:Inorganic pyrophosphatase n=1 Tax=Sulfurihydrogenibium azorense TaxID=309806 RepID=A0A832D987_9AQUI|nr:MAG: inorganic diphosphatase [Sulfurihydrogenibium sp.]PMP63827.1 MAG: inorganic diphosphatase [Sulfurihydrogenibium sp.]PMP77826.1 MAG: inorganic diphosphatase [Sulfurihydrogenibium sp.]HEV08808.1 inorganic diphosphatase [Sulfurihydrogenibium azorense]